MIAWYNLNMKKTNELIRINKFLLLKKICSRREADRLIEKGMVFVNGKKAKLGQKVSESDDVSISKEAKRKIDKKIIILVNKPIGYVSHNPQRDEKDVLDLLNFKEKLSPVGRLDKKSHGLLLMTNDGRIVDRLLNPAFAHEKEYFVTVNKRVTQFFLKQMSDGVDIEGYVTKKAQIEKVDSHSFYLTLTEGKKHQIRRMCQALGYEVQDLQRVRIMNLELDDLPLGKYRVLKGEEKIDFMKSIGL